MLRIIALGVIVVGLARPQTYRTVVTETDSVDIMIVLDMSKSMEETDLRRDRTDAAQRVIRRFAATRKGDRLGLVLFAQQAMLQCPLTLDVELFDRVVADLKMDDIPSLGTAIGDGLGMGLAYLRRSDAKSKIVILLSDGDNNVSTQMTPQQAGEAAKAMKILKSRLFDIEQEKRDAAERATRKAMVGSGDRSEKIRTYNFPQNRMTDHRIGLTLHQLDAVMEGKIEEVISALRTHYQTEALKASTHE